MRYSEKMSNKKVLSGASRILGNSDKPGGGIRGDTPRAPQSVLKSWTDPFLNEVYYPSSLSVPEFKLSNRLRDCLRFTNLHKPPKSPPGRLMFGHQYFRMPLNAAGKLRTGSSSWAKHLGLSEQIALPLWRIQPQMCPGRLSQHPPPRCALD